MTVNGVELKGFDAGVTIVRRRSFLILWKKFLCWRKHDWKFDGGHWVIPKICSFTQRSCKRCHLWQEISHDHVNGIRFLEKEEQR